MKVTYNPSKPDVVKVELTRRNLEVTCAEPFPKETFRGPDLIFPPCMRNVGHGGRHRTFNEEFEAEWKSIPGRRGVTEMSLNPRIKWG